MPLSKPTNREHMHTRKIQCNGYLREDGLWDIEGHITDTKTYSFPNHDRGSIETGENIHDMSIRLSVDSDFLIHDVEVCTDASPFNICPGITDSYKALAGLQITHGWRKNVLSKFGRSKGCTHITELLLGAMATTAYQTLGGSTMNASINQKANNAARLVNTCHALSSDSSVVERQWPELYTGHQEGTE